MKIDRSKKANRYCAHCINFEKKRKNPDYINQLSSHAAKYRKPYICPAADGKLIDYWNRCEHFQWNPDLSYTEPLPEKKER